MRIDGKVVALTGAGSGIGRHLALELASKGAVLALSDVRPEPLEETAALVEATGGRMSTRTVDVADRHQVLDWAAAVVAEHGFADALINNAGMNLPWRPLEEIPYDHLRRILEVNLWGAVHGSLAFLPHLRQRSEASLVNVASMAALVTAPGQIGYSTSKFALRGFTEALQMELSNSPVHVMLVLPGGVRDTNVMRSALGATADEAEAGARMQQGLPMATSPSDAAAKIVMGIEKNRTRLLVGKDVALMSLVVRAFPSRYKGLVERMAAKSQP